MNAPWVPKLHGAMLREEIKNEPVIATFKGTGNVIEETSVYKGVIWKEGNKVFINARISNTNVGFMGEKVPHKSFPGMGLMR